MTRTARGLRPQEEWIAIPVPMIIKPPLFEAVQEQLSRRYRCASVYILNPDGGKCRGQIHADEAEAQVWRAVERVLLQPEIIAAEVQRQHTQGISSVRRSSTSSASWRPRWASAVARKRAGHQPTRPK